MARHIVTFAFTGGLQTQVIPANYAGGFQFDIAGGQGGASPGQGAYSSLPGGKGGRVTGTYSPAIGDTINVYVGGQGATGGFSASASVTAAAGGYGYHLGGAGGSASWVTNFNAWGGGAGGGSSAVLDGVTLIAAAGGGGGSGPAQAVSGSGQGGYGGSVALAGAAGAVISGSATGGGGPGTGSGQGAGGIGRGEGSGAAGSAGGGGAGGNATTTGSADTLGGGGGGGGGTGGGGGGGAGNFATSMGAGGGGGYSSAPGAGSPAYFDNYQAGNGTVNLSWQTLPGSAPSAPTGTITATSQPAVTAAYSSADSAPMQAYRIVIYSAAQTMPAAPAIAASPLWDSGVVFATGSSVTVTPGTLPNGNLIAYVAFEDSAGADSLWSAWASTSWVQAAPQPNTPQVTVTPLPAAARVNLAIVATDNMVGVNDADFEGGDGVWGSSPGGNTVNCSIAQSTAQAQHGTHSMSMSSTAAGNMSASTPNPTSGPPVVGFPVAPGNRYVAMASFRAATTGRNCTIGLAWWTAAGALISTVTSGTVADVTTGWTQAVAAGVAPANAAYAQLVLTVQATGGAAEVHYVDEAGLFYAAAGTPAWGAGGNYPAYFVVQRSLDGGTTWTTVHAGAQVAVDEATVSFDDVGAPREQTITYRVQSVAVSGGSTFVSQWSGNQVTNLASDGNDWLFAASSEALATKITYEGPNLAALSHEDQQVYFPEGRSDAVVFHGTIHYEQFVNGVGSSLLTFAFPNDAAWNNFKAMRASQQPLLLKTVYGDTTREQFWITLAADGGTTRYGGGEKALPGQGLTQQIRKVQIGAYVVNEPA